MKGEVEAWFYEWVGFLVGFFFSLSSLLFVFFLFAGFSVAPREWGRGLVCWSVGSSVSARGRREGEEVGRGFVFVGRKKKREGGGRSGCVGHEVLAVGLGVVLEEEVSALGRRKKKFGAEVVVLSF